MDKLDDLFRGFRSGVTAPSEDAVSAARELLLGEIGSSERPRPLRPKRRWVFSAIAAAALVGGLLVTPAFGLGSRLLDLIYDRSATREVQTPVWSPDGQRIAFVSRRDGNSEVYVMSADGSAQENLSRHQGDDSAPTWSPDGRMIAFVSRRDGNSEVYVMSADGSGQRNLSRHQGDDRAPTWSPDGRRIAYMTACCQSRHIPPNYLYVVNANGSGLQRLTPNPWGTDGSPAWSPDGRTIRFAGYLVNADGSGQRRLPSNIPLNGAWSPDGRKIAFVKAFNKGSPNTTYEIHVMNTDGSGEQRLTRLTRNPAAYYAPAWSADGRRIAFRSRRNENPEIYNGNPEVYVMNADGSGLRRLTRNPANERWFAWSPDGRKLSFVRDLEIYVVNADGSGERRLTQDSK